MNRITTERQLPDTTRFMRGEAFSILVPSLPMLGFGRAEREIPQFGYRLVALMHSWFDSVSSGLRLADSFLTPSPTAGVGFRRFSADSAPALGRQG